jgi:hypothetical protein
MGEVLEILCQKSERPDVNGALSMQESFWKLSRASWRARKVEEFS